MAFFYPNGIFKLNQIYLIIESFCKGIDLGEKLTSTAESFIKGLLKLGWLIESLTEVSTDEGIIEDPDFSLLSFEEVFFDFSTPFIFAFLEVL